MRQCMEVSKELRTTLRMKSFGCNVYFSKAVSRVCFSSSPTYFEEYHASDKYKRKSDYDKGFNDDWTVTGAGDRIVEMTEKSKIRMEDPWQKLQRKLKKKSETSTADKVQKESP